MISHPPLIKSLYPGDVRELDRRRRLGEQLAAGLHPGLHRSPDIHQPVVPDHRDQSEPGPMRPSGCKTCSSASAQIPGTPGAIRRLASSSFAVMHFAQTRKTPSTVCPARARRGSQARQLSGIAFPTPSHRAHVGLKNHRGFKGHIWINLANLCAVRRVSSPADAQSGHSPGPETTARPGEYERSHQHMYTVALPRNEIRHDQGMRPALRRRAR